MERIVGIFDEETDYAEGLAQYINEKKEAGFFAVSFASREALEEYVAKQRLSCLLLGGACAADAEELSAFVSENGKIWVLTEEEQTVGEQEGPRLLFRYQRAGALLQRLIASERTAAAEEWLYFVYSPVCAAAAEQAARSVAEELARAGRTLLLLWDPFVGREEKQERAGISDLLYVLRGTGGKREWEFLLAHENGVDFFGGADYHTDLWQYSAEEMKELLRYVREQGGYRFVVFFAAFFGAAVEEAARQSRRLYLVGTEDEAGERRCAAFFRQMRYAGAQEILSAVTEVSLSGLPKELRRLAGECGRENAGKR